MSTTHVTRVAPSVTRDWRRIATRTAVVVAIVVLAFAVWAGLVELIADAWSRSVSMGAIS